MAEQPRVDLDRSPEYLPAPSASTAAGGLRADARFANHQFLLNAFHDPVVIVDGQGLIVRANAAALRAFRFAEEKLLGQTIEALLPDRYRRQHVEQRNNYFSAPSSRPMGQNLKLRAQRQNGEEFPVEVSLNPIWDQGQLFVICIIHDITERQQREIKLRDTEARYRTVIEQMPAVTFMASLTGGLSELYVSPQIESLLGYTQQEWLDNPILWHERLHPDDRTRWQTEFAHTCATGIEFSSEYRFLAKSGKVVWVHGVAKMIRDEHGAPLMLHGIAFDITQRKEAEITMHRSRDELENCVRLRTAELAQATEQFELAVKGSNDGIWDWNMETGECYFSTRFQELLGCNSDESQQLMHRFESLKARMHPDDAPLVMQTLQVHLEQAAPFDVNCRLRSNGKPWGWFRLRGQAVRQESGRPRRMAGSLSDISQIKQAEEELVQAALLDKLTKLPNRALLMDRLQMTMERASRSETAYAVMFLDFDRFKYINDSLGHDVGDALLCEIAARLRGQLRTTDTVSRSVLGPSAARMGGDEFVVLLDELHSPNDATAIAQRLLESFSQPYQLGQHEVFSTASIGIVVGNSSYDRAEDVLRDADTAMYEAKRAGKARYIVFDDTMHQRVQRRLKLETDLRKAIDSQQLMLVYQPIISLETGEVKSTEALLRWNHPGQGPISPAEFIPIAEESELILTIGDWVLREGVRQMADWVTRLGVNAPPTVSINLSRKQFIRSNLPQMIESVAAAAGLSPARLQFEITEDTFASDVKSAIAAMNAIKSLGSLIAIDDFGTGSSSFASLHDFPADVLKLDRSLLTSIEVSKDTAALVHSLAILVRNLDMKMVAEGVETQSNVVTLQELGCQYGQGFFFAKPMPAAAFEDYLVNRAARETVVGAEVFHDRWSELLQFSTKWV